MSRSSLLLFLTFTHGKLVTPKEVTMNNDPVSSLPGPLNSGWSFLNSHRKQQLKIIKLEKREDINKGPIPCTDKKKLTQTQYTAS